MWCQYIILNPSELEIKDTSDSPYFVNFLDLCLEDRQHMGFLYHNLSDILDLVLNIPILLQEAQSWQKDWQSRDFPFLDWNMHLKSFMVVIRTLLENMIDLCLPMPKIYLVVHNIVIPIYKYLYTFLYHMVWMAPFRLFSKYIFWTCIIQMVLLPQCQRCWAVMSIHGFSMHLSVIG